MYLFREDEYAGLYDKYGRAVPLYLKDIDEDFMKWLETSTDLNDIDISKALKNELTISEAKYCKAGSIESLLRVSGDWAKAIKIVIDNYIEFNSADFDNSRYQIVFLEK